MFWIIKTTIPIFFSSIFIFFLNRKYHLIKESSKFIWIFSIIWIAFFLSQYYLLGPNSPIHYADNAEQGISRILHDINFHLGQKFAHNINGGVDYYAVQGYFGQYISFERFLFQMFPVWFAIFLHKFLIIILSFFGMFMLLNKAFNFRKIDSLFVSSLFSVINPYATYSTFQHGIGFAVIPFAIYVYLYLTQSKNYFIYTTLLSFLISISVSPLHSFQALFAGLILTSFLKKPHQIKSFLISLLFLLFLVILNWSEVLYGVYEYGQLTSRVLTDENLTNIFGVVGYIANKSDYCFVNCTIQYSPLIIILIVLFIAIILNYKKEYKKIIIFLLICNYLPNLAWLFVDLINFQKASSMNFYDFGFYIYIPISILALKIASKNTNYFSKLSLVFVFFAMITLFYNQINFFREIFLEPQKNIYKINNLVEKKWKKDELSRVVSTNPYNFFHPNFAWAHGLETSDGYTHFVLKNYSDYWFYGVLKKKFSINDKPRYGANIYINSKNSNDNILNLDKKIDFNLLKSSNTKYILSYTPILNSNLKKVSGPTNLPYKSWNKNNSNRNFDFYLSVINEGLNSLNEPPDIFIYEILGTSDRAFFPNKIIKIKNYDNPEIKYRFISRNYEKNTSFVINKKYEPASGEIIELKKIVNGYLVSTNVNEDGLFVLNSFYIPYWKVFINNQESKVLNLSEIHMGVKLDKGFNQIEFRYDRELLREKILKLLN